MRAGRVRRYVSMAIFRQNDQAEVTMTANGQRWMDRRGVKRRKKAKKIFTRGMRITLFAFYVIFVLVFFGLMFRIYMIDRNDGERYKKATLSQQSYSNVLNYQRGSIKDRNNTTMALSLRKYNLVLEPRTLNANEKSKSVTIDAIAEHFSADRESLLAAVRDKPDSLYERFDELKELPGDIVESFQEKMKEKDSDISGVWFEETYIRNYPLGSVGCNLIGFMASDENGSNYGVEESYNNELSGTTGREYGYFDSEMKLQRTIREAKDGNSVILTIDANTQQIVEQQIAKFQKEGVGAKRVAVLIANIKNGEVLAMASDSTFDLNDPGNLSRMYSKSEIASMSEEEQTENRLNMWSNFCIASAYEPGSTFKPFTVAAALDENLVRDSSSFTCKGVLKVADREIHCNATHGIVDLRHSLMESCNCALMDISKRLGRENFYKYNQLYGFGQRTGIDLPGESAGLIHPQEKLNPVELATSGFGQTQAVTMVQMMGAFASVVNGGDYYQPHVVKEIRNSEGDVVETMNPTVIRKTVSEDTSQKIRSILKDTVEEGTASPAKVKGYSIGGKTGTAEKKGRNKKNYLVSFIGCTPAEDPEIGIYVVVDEPNTADQAHSTYATEFAAVIMKKVLPFLGQYPAKDS